MHDFKMISITVIVAILPIIMYFPVSEQMLSQLISEKLLKSNGTILE